MSKQFFKSMVSIRDVTNIRPLYGIRPFRHYFYKIRRLSEYYPLFDRIELNLYRIMKNKLILLKITNQVILA